MSIFKLLVVKIFTILFFFLTHTIHIHEYHASITTINLNTKERSAKISIQVFTDDLYQLFEERFNTSPTNIEKTIGHDLNFQKYLRDKFNLEINRKPINITFLGLEEEGYYTMIYLEGKTLRKNQRIEISNLILTEIFPDQINTVNIIMDNCTKSVHLTNAKNNAVVFFNDTTKL